MTPEELENKIQELENKVKKLEGEGDKKWLPDRFDSNLIKTINDNLFVFGTVYFTDGDPIILPINNVSPENIVLTNYPVLAYIRRNDDDTGNELFIGAGDVGASCNYLVFKNTKIDTSS